MRSTDPDFVYEIPEFNPAEILQMIDGETGRCMATANENPNAPGSGMECGAVTVKCPRCHMDAEVCEGHLEEEASGERVCIECFLEPGTECSVCRRMVPAGEYHQHPCE